LTAALTIRESRLDDLTNEHNGFLENEHDEAQYVGGKHKILQ